MFQHHVRSVLPSVAIFSNGDFKGWVIWESIQVYDSPGTVYDSDLISYHILLLRVHRSFFTQAHVNLIVNVTRLKNTCTYITEADPEKSIGGWGLRPKFVCFLSTPPPLQGLKIPKWQKNTIFVKHGQPKGGCDPRAPSRSATVLHYTLLHAA